MILEVAILNIIPGLEDEFEAAFKQASAIISRMHGYGSHQVRRCLEHPNRYILLVEWETLEDHTIGFRGSPDYQQWKKLLHHFYAPFPEVEHYENPLETSNARKAADSVSKKMRVRLSDPRKSFNEKSLVRHADFAATWKGVPVRSQAGDRHDGDQLPEGRSQLAFRACLIISSITTAPGVGNS